MTDPKAKTNEYRFKEKLPDIRYATAGIENGYLLYENMIFFAAVKGRYTVKKNQYSALHRIIRQKVNDLVLAGFLFSFPELDNGNYFAFRPTERGLAWLKSGDPFAFAWGKKEFPAPAHGRGQPPLFVPPVKSILEEI